MRIDDDVVVVVAGVAVVVVVVDDDDDDVVETITSRRSDNIEVDIFNQQDAAKLYTQFDSDGHFFQIVAVEANCSDSMPMEIQVLELS